MKYRYLEKVKVKQGYFRGYNGVVVGAKTTKDDKIETTEYHVKLTISKDPTEIRTETFQEEELKFRWW